MVKRIPFRALTCAEELIAAGMDPERANLYEEIFAKLKVFKRDIQLDLFDPVKRTENIFHDISVFGEKLLGTGEKQEIVSLLDKTFNDLVMILIINQFGNHAESNAMNQNSKQAVIKHYSLQDYVMLLRKSRNYEPHPYL